MGCVGGNAERELLLRILPCGLEQVQPALISLASSLQTQLESGALEKIKPHFNGELT
jgi:hypothetical protein